MLLCLDTRAKSRGSTSKARSDSIATYIGEERAGELEYSSVVVGGVRPLRSDDGHISYPVSDPGVKLPCLDRLSLLELTMAAEMPPLLGTELPFEV